MRILFIYLFIFMKLHCVLCLQNGLARTPPMGWLAWERFQCNTYCDTDPDNCISEKLFMTMADRLVRDGYKEAGYEYLNIDDCWMDSKRDKDGNMVADPIRFPRGIKFLADYVHSKGLKLGIYQDFGTRTCMGYPGLLGHIEQDIKKIAEWEVDMIKIDACHSNIRKIDEGYIKIGKHLQQSGRHILYSCSWPYYQLISNLEPDYELVAKHCNIWRNYHDIHDSWKSIQAVIDFFGDNQELLTKHTGPGAWSDPDMLMIGNHDLTPGQSRIQMAVWAMIPGPLLMSNDLRQIKYWARNILLNKKVIAINQDYLGIPGKRIFKKDKCEIWKRNVLPTSRNETSYAILLINRQSMKKAKIFFILNDLELENKSGYLVTNVFSKNKYGVLHPNESINFYVEPMDLIMLHFSAL